MNQNLLFIILLSFLFHANSQGTDSSYVHDPLHPQLASIFAILVILISMAFLIVLYAKFCQTIIPDQQEQNPGGLFRSRSNVSGINRTVIESLPFFTFSSLKGSKEGMECAVCLSKFEDSEILRMLPKCRHAFHMNCIDQWLERHSSCPLCRYKFDVEDLTNFTCTNSLRYPPRISSNLTEDQTLELYVQRQQDHQSSSRFNLGGSFRKLLMGKKDETLIQQDGNTDYDAKLFHKFKHRIIISDIVHKSRWSDVNSSDLLLLNSEMINVMSSRRFSTLSLSSKSLQNDSLLNEQIAKIKKDIQTKRRYEKITASNPGSISDYPISDSEINDNPISRSLNPAGKRSMSEIANCSRFGDRVVGIRSRLKENLVLENSGRDERMRRLWLSIARRTVQWFAGREGTSQESEIRRQPSNV